MSFRFAFCLLLFLCLPFCVQAREIFLIGDEETERLLYSFQRPLFQKAGLDARTVKIRLIKDGSLNAFAVQGGYVFVHTGLLLKANDAQEVIAVLAHETGHVAGGHIIRLAGNVERARRNVMISMLLGTLAAAAGGTQAGAAVIAGGMNAAEGMLAGYRRAEENAADQAAVSLLKATGHDLSGFESVMKKLERQERLTPEYKETAFLRSHPAVRERLEFVSEKRKQAKGASPSDMEAMRRENEAFKRVQAKLYAFLEPFDKTFLRYPESDTGIAARYARAIACYRKGRFDDALRLTDALIRDYPSDPYFYELKGQMLFETGRAEQAVSAYEKASALLHESVLMRIGLAQAQIETDRPEMLKAAVKNLEFAAAANSDFPFVRRLQATAYSRTGQDGMAAYAMAEYHFLNGDMQKAALFARKALKSLDAGSAAGMRAADISVRSEEDEN